MKLDEHWRLFVAIELPGPVRRRIGTHIDRLREALPDVRASWVREQNLHFTLKFFGDTPIEKVDSLSQALDHATAGLNSFDLEIAGCGAFLTRGKPSVLWLGVSEPAQPSVIGLHKSIEDHCAGLGFEHDRRPFHPHLTIARLRSSNGARQLGDLHRQTDFETVSVKVEEVCLIRSELSSEGSRYTVTARHRLVTAG
jgi:RNA 2',3'-cyclic 3'-phosphodiesterase